MHKVWKLQHFILYMTDFQPVFGWVRSGWGVGCLDGANGGRDPVSSPSSLLFPIPHLPLPYCPWAVLQSLLPSVSDRALWVTVPDWWWDWGGFLQAWVLYGCVTGSGFPETNWRKGVDGREGKRGDGGEGER